jgi:hypothetical protein
LRQNFALPLAVCRGGEILVCLLFVVRLVDRLMDAAFGLATLALRGSIRIVCGLAGRATAPLRAARASRPKAWQ